MRSLLVAATGLLSVSLLACSTPEERDGDGDGSGPLPPLARAFEGVLDPAALATGPDGDVFFAGSSFEEVDFGGGVLPVEPAGSVFIAHLDAGGEHLFSGSTGSDDRPRDVAVGPSGDLYVVGGFDDAIAFGSGTMTGEDDAFFAAFTDEGSPDHSFSAGGAAEIDVFTGVASGPAGIVVVAGQVSDEADLGAGVPAPATSPTGLRTFVAAYDREGKHLWERRFQDDNISGIEIATGPAGDIFLAGESYGSVVADDFSVPAGLFVMKLASSGEPLWVQSTDSSAGEVDFHSMAAGAEGDVVVTGRYSDAFDLGGVQVPYPGGDFGGFVARLDGDGETKHVSTFSVFGESTTLSLGASKTGGVVLAASTYRTVNFGTGPKGSPNHDNWSVVIARWSAAGDLIDVEELPGTGDEKVIDVAMAGDSAVLLGTFDSGVTIGEETFTTTKNRSLFLGRLDW